MNCKTCKYYKPSDDVERFGKCYKFFGFADMSASDPNAFRSDLILLYPGTLIPEVGEEFGCVHYHELEKI